MTESLATLSHFPQVYLPIVIILSVIIGSFINMLAYRIPAMMQIQYIDDCQALLDELGHTVDLKESTKDHTTLGSLNLFSPSFCPHCQNQLKAWHNIPILSYVLLRGRCGHCHTPIAKRYFVVEVAALIIGLLLVWKFGLTQSMLCYALFSYALLTLAAIDFETQLLPDSITIPLVWLGLLFAYVDWIPLNLGVSLVGAILGYLFLYIFFWIFKFITGKEGFGYGDFKLLAAIGAWLGPFVILAVVVISALLGIIISQLVLRTKRGEAFAFGPYIAIAGFIVLIAKDTSLLAALMIT